jgi:signal transduction histidine kinase
LWPSPDPDVFGDKVYSWKFLLAINVPMVLAFYALIVFTPLRAWTGLDPLVLAAGCALQLGAFAGVLAYGYRRIHPGLRELITYAGNLAATVSLPLATDKSLVILWALFLLIVFFEAFGNPKAFSAFALTLLAPWASVLGHMDSAQSGEKILMAAMITPIGGIVYLLVAYVGGWTREGAVDKANRARERGAREERARIEHSLEATLGTALSEISLWHEVALASDVAGASSVAKARERARDALTELRSLVAGFDLQPASMAGLAAEIQRRAGNLCAAEGIAFEFKIGKLGNINLRDSYHLAMLAVEAVDNAARHAKPRSVSVSLSASPLEVSVEDDGAGFDLENTRPGRGLRDFEELANALGGPLEIDTAPGRGTRVRVRVERT